MIKNWLNIRVLTLLIAVSGFSCQSKKSNEILIEAESGQFSILTIEKDSVASGGTYLALKDEGQVLWDVVVDKDAYYNLQIRFRASGGSKEQFIIKNGIDIPIGFAEAKEWTVFNQCFYLNKGKNEIGIKASWGNMDFDYLKVSEQKVNPTISPLKQTVYSSNTSTIVYKVDNYHQHINKVKIDGKSVDFETAVYPHQEKSVWLTIPHQVLQQLQSDTYNVEVLFETDSGYATFDRT